MESRITFNLYAGNQKIGEQKAHTKWEAIDKFCNQRGFSPVFIKARPKK